MPHRRQVRKGSFGGRLDQLVGHFPDKQRAARGRKRTEPGKPTKDDRHINERLFEAAWGKGREERPATGPVEQP